MKKLFLSLIAMAFATGMMAQDSRVATLQHGTNFRTYYGTDAFISAHADAADGDVITLTAGEFSWCNITKAITVRGEGMKKTILRVDYGTLSYEIPTGSQHSLCIEGVKIYIGVPGSSPSYFYIQSTEGSASIMMSKCSVTATGGIYFNNINAAIIDSEIKSTMRGRGKSSMTCINSILPSIEEQTFDVNNCVIKGNVNRVTNSIIKNSIIYGVSTLDNTNTTSNCLVKEGSSGFANSWYIKTEVDPNPDPWGEDPETPVLWDELFGEDYHLTDAAAATYIGTDGTQIGIWGGAYPWNETPDYPLVNKLEVKGIHENGKLQVKINVQ